MTKASRLLLAPLGVIYGTLTRVRLALYKTGSLKIHKISSPVLSVGNLTTGGTGKTPLVEWVARVVAREGRRVCILTRGYGRGDAKRRVLVSDGEKLLADAQEGGDEPRLLAEALLGTAAVLAEADRVSAARWAEEHLGSDTFILDDGFQHLRLARDLDIVTIDATNPWGGGLLLPRGRLREPLGGLSRADALILTRTELSAETGSLRREVEELSGGRPVFLSRTRTVAVRPLDERMLGSAAPGSPPQPLAAFCGLGNPQAFFAHLSSDGYVLNHVRAFPDHHVYTQADVNSFVLEAKQAGALALVTTAKDGVKLRSLNFELPCYVLEIGLECDDEEKLTRLIREALKAKNERTHEDTRKDPQ